MTILNAKLNLGEIKGVDIGGPQQLLYSMFADNTGLFFEATKENLRQ